jgi:hypothetical protein
VTRIEFDGWVEEHYTELRAVARKQYGQQDADDVLHNAFLSLLESQMLAAMPLSLAWPWAVSQMRGRAGHLHESRDREEAAKESFRSDDPFAASILDRGERYKAHPVVELNGEPLGAAWSRWVGDCPRCGGPASMEIITDREAPTASAAETEVEALARRAYVVKRQKVMFCINGHRADYKRGTRPQGGSR